MAGIEKIAGVTPAKMYEYIFRIQRNPSTVAISTDLPYRVRTLTVPDSSSEPIEINFRFMKAEFAGRDASGHTFDVTFWDDISLSSYKALYEWRKMIQNSVAGTQSDKSEYTGDIQIDLLGSAGENDILSSYMIYYAYPENLQQVSLDYSSSDAFNFSVTFKFDWFTLV